MSNLILNIKKFFKSQRMMWQTMPLYFYIFFRYNSSIRYILNLPKNTEGRLVSQIFVTLCYLRAFNDYVKYFRKCYWCKKKLYRTYITGKKHPYTYSGNKLSNETYIFVVCLKRLAINPNIPQIYNVSVNPLIRMEKLICLFCFISFPFLYHEHAIFLHNWA